MSEGKFKNPVKEKNNSEIYMELQLNYRIYSPISRIFGSRKLSEKWGSDL